MGSRLLPVPALALALLLAACGNGLDRDGERELVLALDFTPNAAHAGVYAAALEEEDAARGLHLEIRPPPSSADSLRLLAAGRADAAIVDIHDLGLARERGAGIVGIGAIVQRPLAAVIADDGIERPRQLEGRRVGVAGLPSDDAVLRAVVEADGGDIGAVDTVTIGFAAVRELAAGSVDAVTAFWNAEGVVLRERGVETTEFRVDDFGAPPYPELVLAARAETVAAEPELLEALLGTLAAGTEAALEDPDAALAEITARSAADPELVRAQFEAVAPALRPPLELDPATLEDWARFDVRFGILDRRPEIGETFALALEPAP